MFKVNNNINSNNNEDKNKKNNDESFEKLGNSWLKIDLKFKKKTNKQIISNFQNKV